MTTLELYEYAAEKSRSFNLPSGPRKLVAAFAMWRARRRTVLRLAGLDAYLLRDIGLEQADVNDALDGDARRLWMKIITRNGIR